MEAILPINCRTFRESCSLTSSQLRISERMSVMMSSRTSAAPGKGDENSSSRKSRSSCRWRWPSTCTALASSAASVQWLSSLSEILLAIRLRADSAAGDPGEVKVKRQASSNKVCKSMEAIPTSASKCESILEGITVCLHPQCAR